jgi:hypothetical protein
LERYNVLHIYTIKIEIQKRQNLWPYKKYHICVHAYMIRDKVVVIVLASSSSSADIVVIVIVVVVPDFMPGA